jgi:BlaR1 peptidase M56
MIPLLLSSAVSNWMPFSFHNPLPGGILVLLDAALRTLLVACVVAAGLRILAPRYVPAQKIAWGLVLAGALLMPLLAPWAGSARWLPSSATWVVTTRPLLQDSRANVAPIGQSTAANDAMETATPVRPPTHARGVDHHRNPAVSTRLSRSGNSLSTGRFPAPTITYGQAVPKDASVTHPAATSYYLPLSDLAWMIYGAVTLAFLLRLSYGLGGAIGLWQSAQPVLLDPRLAGDLPLRRSNKISSPVTVGSAVVLPDDYEEWDTEKLRIVLAHERSHVRQRDFYLQALAGLYAAIFWFSPLGWWLKRKLADLSETISDRAGLEEAGSHASYAQILLEFAAKPRRIQVGVAMANSGRISQRIERLLNESSFRQAFAGGRGRLWAALLMVPIVLFAAAALIRVEAAQTFQQPVTEQGPVIHQSHPAIAPIPALAPIHAELAAPVAPASVQTPAAPTTPPPADSVVAQAPAPAPPAPAPVPATAGVPAVAPLPPAAVTEAEDAEPDPDADQDQDQETVTAETKARCASNTATSSRHRSYTHVSSRHGSAYAFSSDGDSYALVSGNDKDHINFSGDWYEGRRADFDKARAQTHGDFLWFTHDGKSYVVDDPQTIARIQAMYKPMEDLGHQQEELGRKQEELGRQQEELGRHQEQASIPTPDVSREMAQLNAVLAKLESKKNGTITMEQLADIQAKIGDLQGKLGDLEGEIGAHQGEIGRQQGLLGEQQGRLGAEQGRLGAEQGRLGQEADRKVKSIMDESLKNGKARPVQ